MECRGRRRRTLFICGMADSSRASWIAHPAMGSGMHRQRGDLFAPLRAACTSCVKAMTPLSVIGHTRVRSCNFRSAWRSRRGRGWEWVQTGKAGRAQIGGGPWPFPKRPVAAGHPQPVLLFVYKGHSKRNGRRHSAGNNTAKVLLIHPVLHPDRFPPFSTVCPCFPRFAPRFPSLSPHFCPPPARFPLFTPFPPLFLVFPHFPHFPRFPVVYDVPGGIPDLGTSRPRRHSTKVMGAYVAPPDLI